ncbi:MAG: hypothetical protein ACK4E8_11815 [Lacibacter sp.]
MNKKHFLPAGLLLALLLLTLAAAYYPGGTPANPHTKGYSFTQNYISNLLDETAINGAPNKGRIWAIAGVLVASLTFGLFFISFANRVERKAIARVIRYGGIVLTATALLVVIPSLHNAVVVVSFITTLFVFFYITVLCLQARLRYLKILSIVFLAFHYLVAYLYFTRTQLIWMPALQKTVHLLQIIWILALHYGTKPKDFQ